ncbi:zinc-finger associated domain containing protein [Oryctes borbonicus]|uniref:Zinc-finger associated domain containing protein n=1 Tax=Oryctes borbonicus TaxID=1629725 RepID=A0A0T6BD37_9SCAR|nr:zinc-finger associated domain containing protein [Oryctes borbonicus]
MSRRPIVTCRTCSHMNQTYIGMVDIFEQYEQNKPLSEVLTECTDVKVERLDGLPIHMCNTCVEKLISAWNFRLMALCSDKKFRNNKDTTAPIFLESNEITEDIVCGDVNIKQEEITIKLEESDLMLVNTEVGNKLDGQLHESNLLMGEYTDCMNPTLEENKLSSSDICKELRVELRNFDDFDSNNNKIRRIRFDACKYGSLQ